LADIVVANVVANGLMQHPNQSQHSYSITSETKAIYRAQGPPITVELPLRVISSNGSSVDRALALTQQNVQRFESDYHIRKIANRLALQEMCHLLTFDIGHKT
jgi:hypothetical protein